MTNDVIFDFSFAHEAVVKTLLKHKPGELCTGIIAYAGCWDTRKNITKAELQALLDHGYQVALTVENIATEGIGGRPVGVAHGAAIVNAAKQLGYDWEHCWLNTGYDTNAVPGDYPKLNEYAAGFASVVPVPGYYGDSDSIDYLHAHGHSNFTFWQSESGSFSPKHPTPNAHLLQLFDDPRARGLAVDVNDIKRRPLHMMGEEADMPLSDEDAEKVARYVWAHKFKVDDRADRRADYALFHAWDAAVITRAHVENRLLPKVEGITKLISAAGHGVLPRVAALQKAVDDLAAAVAKVTPAGVANVDADAIAKAVVAALKIPDAPAIAAAVANRVKALTWKVSE